MPFISFSKPTFRFLYPILHGPFYVAKEKVIAKSIFSRHRLVYFFLCYISMALCFFYCLIFEKKKKIYEKIEEEEGNKRGDNEEKDGNSVQLFDDITKMALVDSDDASEEQRLSLIISQRNTTTSVYYSLKFLLVVFLFDLLETFLDGVQSISDESIKKILSCWPFELVFIALISKYFLKINIYRHNFISLASVVLIFTFVTVIEVAKNIKDLHNIHLVYLTLNIVLYFADASVLCLIKWLFEKKLCGVLKLIYTVGGMGCLVGLVLNLVFTFIHIKTGETADDCYIGTIKLIFDEESKKCYLDNFFLYVKDVKEGVLKEFLYIFVFMILQFLNNYLLNYTILHFQPSYKLISYCIQFMIKEIISFIIDGNIMTSDMILIVSIFLFLCIYTEIIILHFCGMDENIREKVYEKEIQRYDNIVNK